MVVDSWFGQGVAALILNWRRWPMVGSVALGGTIAGIVLGGSALLSAPAKAPCGDRVSSGDLYHRARLWTVRLEDGEGFLGSGTLVPAPANPAQPQVLGSWILTNAHVLRDTAAPYRASLAGGETYAAVPLAELNLGSTDLAVLALDRKPLPPGDLRVGARWPMSVQGVTPPEPVVSAGWVGTVAGNQSFLLTEGRSTLILGVPVQGGYQVGHDTWVDKGMSGGPLLNRQGFLVGLNGLHADPLFPWALLDDQGQKLSPDLQAQVDRYSWAIPLDRILQLLPSLPTICP